MKMMQGVLIGCCLLGGLTECATRNPLQSNVNSSESCHVLLIGSSYFNYNNLPEMFVNLAKKGGQSLHVETAVTNGLYLADHAASAATLRKIQSRAWDWVVLQGVGRITAYPQAYTDHPVYPALYELCQKIRSNCETTEVLFCMPWAYEDGMTWRQGWTDDYADMQAHIYTHTLDWSKEMGFKVAPVGWAWKAVLEEKGYPLHYLHQSDWNHPSRKGSYLMASVIYATLFGEAVSSNAYHGGLSASEAEMLRIVASRVVMDELPLWYGEQP